MPDEEEEEELQLSASNLSDAAKGKTDTIILTKGKKGGRPVKAHEVASALQQAGVKKDWAGTLMFAFPDVCKTPAPPSPVPIPYPDLAQIGDIKGESKRVKVHQSLLQAGFKNLKVKSVGDEAGTLKGMMGAKAHTKGHMFHAFDVKMEGQKMLRAFEVTHVNQQSTHVPHMAPSQSKVIVSP